MEDINISNSEAAALKAGKDRQKGEGDRDPSGDGADNGGAGAGAGDASMGDVEPKTEAEVLAEKTRLISRQPRKQRFAENLAVCFRCIEKGVAHRDEREFARAVRRLTAMREVWHMPMVVYAAKAVTNAASEITKAQEGTGVELGAGLGSGLTERVEAAKGAYRNFEEFAIEPTEEDLEREAATKLKKQEAEDDRRKAAANRSQKKGQNKDRGKEKEGGKEKEVGKEKEAGKGEEGLDGREDGKGEGKEGKKEEVPVPRLAEEIIDDAVAMLIASESNDKVLPLAIFWTELLLACVHIDGIVTAHKLASHKLASHKSASKDHVESSVKISTLNDISISIDTVMQDASAPASASTTKMITWDDLKVGALVRDASALFQKESLDEARRLLRLQSKLTLDITVFDPLEARVVLVFSRLLNLYCELTTNSTAESTSTLQVLEARELLKSSLILTYRRAVLASKPLTQATVINQLVQAYIGENDFESAMKFMGKSNFPEHIRAPLEVVRYLFNQGRIDSARLQHAEASEKMMTAVRKLPPNETFASAFKILAYKHSIVADLLRGDVPPIALFQTAFASELSIYKEVILAVRAGDLNRFESLLQTHSTHFIKDGTFPLVDRLRHSVINAGLRRLNLSYSRISLADMAAALSLTEDALESVLGRAIEEGVLLGKIEAVPSPSGDNATVLCFVSSTSSATSKSFAEAHALNEYIHKKIEFCQQTQTNALQAIQFPDKGTRRTKAQGADETDQRDAEELIAEAQEDDSDDDFF